MKVLSKLKQENRDHSQKTRPWLEPWTPAEPRFLVCGTEEALAPSQGEGAHGDLPRGCMDPAIIVLGGEVTLSVTCLWEKMTASGEMSTREGVEPSTRMIP